MLIDKRKRDKGEWKSKKHTPSGRRTAKGSDNKQILKTGGQLGAESSSKTRGFRPFPIKTMNHCAQWNRRSDTGTLSEFYATFVLRLLGNLNASVSLKKRKKMKEKINWQKTTLQAHKKSKQKTPNETVSNCTRLHDWKVPVTSNNTTLYRTVRAAGWETTVDILLWNQTRLIRGRVSTARLEETTFKGTNTFSAFPSLFFFLLKVGVELGFHRVKLFPSAKPHKSEVGEIEDGPSLAA